MKIDFEYFAWGCFWLMIGGCSVAPKYFEHKLKMQNEQLKHELDVQFQDKQHDLNMMRFEYLKKEVSE